MALIQANFTSVCLKRTVPFVALLPLDPEYPTDEPLRLPLKTLYLLHGFTESCMAWLTSFALGDFVKTHNIAIIMPDAENHFYIDDMMRNDLYGEFIGRELVDFTRKVFPLSDKADDTIIGGISMGGFGALRNGMKYNDVFGHVIGISPANITNELAFSSDRPNHIGATRGYYESVFGNLDEVVTSDMDLFWLASEQVRKGEKFPDIYFACGYNDMLVHENRRFHEHLMELGVKHVYDEGPGTHDPIFFTPHLGEGLARLNLDRNPPAPNPFWIG